MAPATEQKVHELLDKLEKRNGTVVKLMWTLSILILGALVSIGAYTEKQRELTAKVEFIDRNYIPLMFLEGNQTNQYYLVRDLVARLSGAKKEEIDKITSEYREFQHQMNEQMIEMKKAMSSRTRGGNNKPTP